MSMARWPFKASAIRNALAECRAILTDKAEPSDCDALPERERQFCERIDSLLYLMDVFEGFSRALIPFVRKPNAPMIRQLIQFAEMLHDEE